MLTVLAVAAATVVTVATAQPAKPPFDLSRGVTMNVSWGGQGQNSSYSGLMDAEYHLNGGGEYITYGCSQPVPTLMLAVRTCELYANATTCNTCSDKYRCPKGKPGCCYWRSDVPSCYTTLFKQIYDQGEYAGECGNGGVLYATKTTTPFGGVKYTACIDSAALRPLYAIVSTVDNGNHYEQKYRVDQWRWGEPPRSRFTCYKCRFGADPTQPPTCTC
mmetsp:Transcript_33447/g.82081  ORF Transcript_33447/g.82081 Transcript_33447/m.82081 type:complete len:218 (+) Transcript_33447:81-734(+)